MQLKFQPVSIVDIYPVSADESMELPVISEAISAGFPSPAMDFIDLKIDLNKYVVKHPSSTFYGKVKGHSMQDAGISDGDLLVIDKSLEPVNDKIAVCFVDGGFTIKRIRIEKDGCWLIPANDRYQPVKITAENDFSIWGIVTYVIKAL